MLEIFNEALKDYIKQCRINKKLDLSNMPAHDLALLERLENRPASVSLIEVNRFFTTYKLDFNWYEWLSKIQL